MIHGAGIRCTEWEGVVEELGEVGEANAALGLLLCVAHLRLAALRRRVCKSTRVCPTASKNLRVWLLRVQNGRVERVSAHCQDMDIYFSS